MAADTTQEGLRLLIQERYDDFYGSGRVSVDIFKGDDDGFEIIEFWSHEALRKKAEVIWQAVQRIT
jgi:hypothetical protein